MWAERSIFYHLYPLGFCGIESYNDRYAEPQNRIAKIIDWLPTVKNTGADVLLLGPVWEASVHGYDTADYFWLDRRLGTNDDFKVVAKQVHQAGLKLVLDGVFNHVGRSFWAFRDVLEKREASACKDWFTINFDLNNGYNDGLCYYAWEGCDDLIKLNLTNKEVKKHIFAAIQFWIEEFGIDGLRLDVAYCLEPEFIHELREFVDSLKPDFWLLGEVVHGNYRRFLKPGMLDSVTNYEAYKGLWSSCNSMNMYEIAYTLNRQFGENGLYNGYHLYNFLDNHDVSRIASKLNNARHLPLLYTLLFTMPGMPSLYYGSEWGIPGNKKDGDAGLRPYLSAPQENELTSVISKLSELHHAYPALADGKYQEQAVANEFLCFSRDTLIVFVNIGETPAEIDVSGHRFYAVPYSAAVYDENGNCLFRAENF